MLSGLTSPPRSLLDIGGGVGVLQHELAAAGTSEITAVDAAVAYLETTRTEAARRGSSGQWRFVEGDFVELAPGIVGAELVTLDKVICCYPDMAALVGASAAKALQWYAIVVPRDRWWIRWGSHVGNVFLRLFGFRFRSFVHPLFAIDREVVRQGLSLAQWQDRLVWTVRLYRRGPTSVS